MIVRATHATKKQRLLDRCHVHSVRSSCTRGKVCTHAVSSPVACTSRKVSRHVTSEFDVCEIDLDIHRSFVNARVMHTEY